MQDARSSRRAIDQPVSDADRATIRTEVAHEFFWAEHGRVPIDARELAGQIAKDSRPTSTTVASYDLTFSPVKSVSTLWAVADPHVSAAIERAHQNAVRDALAFLEQHALFTHGVATQIDHLEHCAYTQLRAALEDAASFC